MARDARTSARTSSPTGRSGSVAARSTSGDTGPFLRVQADGESLPFADGAFDVDLLRRNAPPRARPGRMVGEMARVTRRGGHVIALNEGTRAVYRSGNAPGPGRRAHLRDQRARSHALRVPLGVRRPASSCGGSSRRTATRRWRSGGSAGSSYGFPSSAGARPPGSRRHPTATRVRASSRRERRPPMRIAVCRPQVPFAHVADRDLHRPAREELRARGHEADLVTVPFKWYPGTRVLTQAFLWRMLDLDEADGRRSTW